MNGHRTTDRPAERRSVDPGERDDRTLSERVVDELAAVRGVAPIELEYPLNDTVDSDALDALFAPRHDGSPRVGDGYVEFAWDGYRVVVRKDGEIRIDSASERST